MPAHAKPKILVVEDDVAVREALIEALEYEGFLVTGAGNGEEAILVLGASITLPQAILLDLMMPAMSGEEFRREQLKNSEWSRIPVVLMSGAAALPNISGRLESMAFIRKPFQLSELIGCLTRILAAAVDERDHA